MATLFIQHRVHDYDAWRTVYDSLDYVRDRQGVTERAVYRLHDDPSTVLVMHRFDSIAQAEAFVKSGHFEAALERVNVVGSSRMEMYEDGA